MRPALLDAVALDRQGPGKAIHLPAPVGGWNTRDAIAAMNPLDAVQLTNFFPSVGEVFARGGSSQFATGMTGTVWSLYQYGVTSGAPLFFAVTDAGVHNITGGGTISAVMHALTNGKWNAIQFTNSAGGNYLWGCNGTDKVAVYNGSAWADLDSGSTPAITGVATTALIWPWQFKRRIWAIEKDSMTAWYFPVDAIAGAAVAFPVGALFSRGGYLLSGTSWTVDGGDGSDDLQVFVTSEGEAAVYQGTDPSSSSTFALVGVYYVGKPLGRRCFVRFGGDVILLTDQGAFPLSKVLQTGHTNLGVAVSSKIQPSFIAASGLYRDVYGWQAVIFPEKNALIVNIPIIAGTRSTQFVMNTLTGAWCDFLGWDAACFTIFDDQLFFGLAGGKVCRAWTSADVADRGKDIVCTGQTAYSHGARRLGLTHVEAFRPLLAYDDVFEIRWGLSTDFDPPKITGLVEKSTVLGQSSWDVGAWDVAPWTFQTQRQKKWRSPRAEPGYAFSLLLQVVTNSAKVSWSGTDFLLNRGAQL